MSEEILYIIGNKIFCKEKQCLFCDKDLMVKGMSKGVIELTCEDHPNFTLYITEKDPIEIFADMGDK